MAGKSTVARRARSFIIAIAATTFLISAAAGPATADAPLEPDAVTTIGAALPGSPEANQAPGALPASVAAADTQAAALPQFVKFADSPNVYVRDAGGVLRLATWSEWSAAGSPAPGLPGVVAGARYFKFGSSASVYVQFGGFVHHVNGSEWASAGYPAAGLPGAIAGARYFKFERSPNVYVQFGSYVHHVNGSEWASAGSPRPGVPGVVPGASYVKFADHPNIYAIVVGNVAALSGAEYSAAGAPAFGTPGRLPGADYYQYATSDAIYVAFSGYIHHLNGNEWAVAGHPAPRVVSPVYQTPGGYLKISHRGVATAAGAGFNLMPGMAGAKVQLVADRLAVGESHQTVSSAFQSKVRAFQQANGLAVTGVVDHATWVRMGFASSDWWELDRYVRPLRVDPRFGRDDYVEAMIATAYEYVGSRYVWGGANAPHIGADCSGLVLQALYSAGIDPRPIDTVRHAFSDFRTSHEFYVHGGFMHVPTSEMRRGDILFWGNPSIHHTAIYLGNGQVVEENGIGRVAALNRVNLMPTVVRPFP